MFLFFFNCVINFISRLFFRIIKLLKDSAQNIEELEKQLYLLEQEKLDLWSLLETEYPSMIGVLKKVITFFLFPFLFYFTFYSKIINIKYYLYFACL